jgi:hypothetical protein
MIIHYNKNYTAMLISIAVFELAVGGLLALTGGGGATVFLLFTGVMLLATGINVRYQPYIAIRPDRVQFYALVGPFKTTYRYDPPDGLRVQADKIYVDHNGVRRRIGISRAMADSADWAAVEARYGVATLPPMNDTTKS